MGLKAVGSLTMMNLRALKTAFRVSVRFSQSRHMHASLQKSPAPFHSIAQLEEFLITQFPSSQIGDMHGNM